MEKKCCGLVWNRDYKFCPQCGKRFVAPLEQLLAYLRRNEKLSVTKRKKGKWKEWAEALEEAMKPGADPSEDSELEDRS